MSLVSVPAVTLEHDVNSALSPLCTTVSVQCTQALAHNNGKTPLRSKHFTWTVAPPPFPEMTTRALTGPLTPI